MCQQLMEVLNESINSKLVSKVFLILDNVKEIRSLNNAGKGCLKTQDCRNSQSFQANRQSPWTHSCKDQCVGACRVMAYDHKTQSFVKNGGQPKCLDKLLSYYVNERILLQLINKLLAFILIGI